MRYFLLSFPQVVESPLVCINLLSSIAVAIIKVLLLAESRCSFLSPCASFGAFCDFFVSGVECDCNKIFIPRV